MLERDDAAQRLNSRCERGIGPFAKTDRNRRTACASLLACSTALKDCVRAGHLRAMSRGAEQVY